MTDHAELATIAVDGPVATLTINRPEQRNAMSLELLEALHGAVDGIAERPELSTLVLTGAGRAFCAGMDLKQVIIDADAGGSGDPELPYRVLSTLAELTLKIRALRCVTLARINGAAIGGGCGLACVCDIAITHAGAKLGFPEVDLGLCPAVIAPWVVRKMGAGPARAAMLMGGVMTGEEAQARGVVDIVASDDAFDDACDDVVTRLAKGGPKAIAATKSLLNELDGSAPECDHVRSGARLSADVVATPEAQANLIARLR